MDQNTRELLAKAGWAVMCESPLELAHRNGSFATIDAAQLVIREMTKGKPLVTSEWTLEAMKVRIDQTFVPRQYDASDRVRVVGDVLRQVIEYLIERERT